MDERLTAIVRGHVQGVGFRWWTQAQADELGLVGHARNLPDGEVEVVAEGPRDRLEELLARLQRPHSRWRPGRVAGVAVQWSAALGDVDRFGPR
jgi:acylphosphatase